LSISIGLAAARVGLALAIWSARTNIELPSRVTEPMRLRLAAPFLLLLCSLPAFAGGGSPAGEPTAPNVENKTPVKAIVELFTSQGCSSCPPADALLKTYAESEGIIALSLPVDYWDYIGWKDTLASPRHTDRQRTYARKFGIGPVYTPQVVVNGTKQVIGSNRAKIDEAIEEASAAFESQRIPVHFWHAGRTVIIETGGSPDGAKQKEATIWLAVVQKSAVVDIKRGENAGKTLTYYNVVRELTPVGLWNGRPAQIRLARAAIMHPDSESLFVLVQEIETGFIKGAARLGD
jgi:hypothetical protein